MRDRSHLSEEGIGERYVFLLNRSISLVNYTYILFIVIRVREKLMAKMLKSVFNFVVCSQSDFNARIAYKEQIIL